MIFEDKPTTASVLPCSRISRMGSGITYDPRLLFESPCNGLVQTQVWATLPQSNFWFRPSSSYLLTSRFCFRKHPLQRFQELFVVLVSSHRHAKAGGETVN